MPKSSTLNLCIQGIDPQNLLPEWVEHRAQTLSLAGWMAQPGAGTLIVTVTGSAIMLEAFEVACSLGPANASVTDIHQIDASKLSEFNPACTF